MLQEVHIRGKKAFGFQYETRLFVSEVEEGSPAMDYLLPGDEIVQVNNNNTHSYTTHCTEIFHFQLAETNVFVHVHG